MQPPVKKGTRTMEKRSRKGKDPPVAINKSFQRKEKG
jgi:hypothetical protein